MTSISLDTPHGLAVASVLLRLGARPAEAAPILKLEGRVRSTRLTIETASVSLAGQPRRIGDLVGMMDSIRDGKKADSRTFALLRALLAEAAGTTEHAELLQAVADTPPVVAMEVNGRTVFASVALPDSELERLIQTPA